MKKSRILLLIFIGFILLTGCANNNKKSSSDSNQNIPKKELYKINIDEYPYDTSLIFSEYFNYTSSDDLRVYVNFLVSLSKDSTCSYEEVWKTSAFTQTNLSGSNCKYSINDKNVTITLNLKKIKEYKNADWSSTDYEDRVINGKFNEDYTTLTFDLADIYDAKKEFTLQNTLHKRFVDNNFEYVLYNPEYIGDNGLYDETGQKLYEEERYNEETHEYENIKPQLDLTKYEIKEYSNLSVAEKKALLEGEFGREKVKVYIFEAEGCPHCENQFQYLKELDSYNKKFEIIEKELYTDTKYWVHGKDYNLAMKIYVALNQAGLSNFDIRGVPVIIISDLYASTGYNDNLESIISDAYVKGDKDIVGCIESGKENCLDSE